jgi:hypothetical protein
MLFSVTKIMMILARTTSASPTIQSGNFGEFTCLDCVGNSLMRFLFIWMSQIVQVCLYSMLVWIVLDPLPASFASLFSMRSGVFSSFLSHFFWIFPIQSFAIFVPAILIIPNPLSSTLYQIFAMLVIIFLVCRCLTTFSISTKSILSFDGLIELRKRLYSTTISTSFIHDFLSKKMPLALWVKHKTKGNSIVSLIRLLDPSIANYTTSAFCSP